jgi:post-segregation antitoxin (ccd killing protein)
MKIETTTVNIGEELKLEYEKFNYENRENKINLSELARNALKEELEKRKVEINL